MEVGKLYKSIDWDYEHSLYEDENDFDRYYWQGLSPKHLLSPKDIVMVLGEEQFSGGTLAKVLYKNKVLYVLKHYIIPVSERQKLAGR